MATTVFDRPTEYNDATQSASGLMSATDKTKLDGVATGATANVGTITGVTMNGASKGTFGVVDLGTVITEHQDISGKVNTSDIENNLTTTTAGKVLDARQGKTLNDSIAKQRYTYEYGANSTLAGIQSDADTLTNELVGIYNVGYVNSAGSAGVGLGSGAWFIYMIKHNVNRACLVFVNIENGKVAYCPKVTTWNTSVIFEVIDNLTSTSTTSALSANQGKVLNDGKVGYYEVSSPNFNTVITAGLYGIQGGSPTNYPPTTSNKFGTLLVLEYRRSTNNYYTQVFFNHSDEIFYRHSNANAASWNDWYEITTSKKTTDYSSSVTAGQSGTTLSDAYLKKFGNVVTLSCVLKNSSTSASKTISAYSPLVTFPSSIGLPSQHIMAVGRGSNSDTYDFYLSKYYVDGDSTKGQVLFGSALTLSASGWVKFSVTWIV